MLCIGLYPIVTSQYSSTNLNSRFPFIFSRYFPKVTIGFNPILTCSERRGSSTDTDRGSVAGRRLPSRVERVGFNLGVDVKVIFMPPCSFCMENP